MPCRCRRRRDIKIIYERDPKNLHNGAGVLIGDPRYIFAMGRSTWLSPPSSEGLCVISKWMVCLFAGSALAGVAHAAEPTPIRITVIADLNDDLYDARSGRGRSGCDPHGGCRFRRLGTGPAGIGRRAQRSQQGGGSTGLAAQAYDAGADLWTFQNSPIALAISKVATERRKLAISTGSASPALTRAACSKYFYHYSFDLTSIATATSELSDGAIPKQALGHDRRGHRLGRGTASIMSPVVAAHGGEIVKSIVIPVQNSDSDFSTALGDIRGLDPDVVTVFDDAAKGRCRHCLPHKGRAESDDHDVAALSFRRGPDQGRVRRGWWPPLHGTGTWTPRLAPGPTGSPVVTTAPGRPRPRPPTIPRRCNG